MSWDDWFIGGDDAAGWSDTPSILGSSDFIDNGSIDWSSLIPQGESYGYNPFDEINPSDYYNGSGYIDTPTPTESFIDSGGLGNGSYAQYNSPQSQGTNFWDTLDKAGKLFESPAGKLATGLFGGALSAYGASRQNKMTKDAYKKQQEMIAARMARNQAYDTPVNFTQARLRQVPIASRGESSWYSDNALSANKPTSAKGIFAAAEGGQPPKQMDTASIGGLLRYLLAGKQLPAEMRAEAEAKAHRARWDAGSRLRQLEANALGEEPPQYEPVQRACGGGLSSYVRGGTSGQDDQIQAMLSDGEYVMDADVVSALGDGNNEAGAEKLDKMREKIRTHKRAAPSNKIPPKAKAPEAYLKGK